MITTRITYLLRKNSYPAFWLDWEEKNTAQKRIEELKYIHPDIADWVRLFVTYKKVNRSPEFRGIIMAYDRSIDNEKEEDILKPLDLISTSKDDYGSIVDYYVRFFYVKNDTQYSSSESVISFENEGKYLSNYTKELIKWKIGKDYIFSI